MRKLREQVLGILCRLERDGEGSEGHTWCPAARRQGPEEYRWPVEGRQGCRRTESAPRPLIDIGIVVTVDSGGRSGLRDTVGDQCHILSRSCAS